MTCPIHCEIGQLVRRSGSGGSTNLSLSEDGEEQIHEHAFGNQWTDDQQRAHSEKGRGLDEHRGDGLVQPTEPSWRLRCGTNVPAAQDKSDDDHEGEEDVERQCDQMVCKVVPDIVDQHVPWPDRQDASRYIVEISLECHRVQGELRYVPTEPRNMMQGKAITQKFME